MPVPKCRVCGKTITKHGKASAGRQRWKWGYRTCCCRGAFPMETFAKGNGTGASNRAVCVLDYSAPLIQVFSDSNSGKTTAWLLSR